MASESRDDRSLAVELPADLEEWVDERARDLGMDRSELVVQVLAAYHAAGTLEDDDAGELLDLDASDLAGLDTAVDEALESTLDEAIEDALDETVRDAVEDVLADRAGVIATEVEDAVAEEIVADVGTDLEAIEADFQTKIEDVRERVIQVKREADSKAPADHTHDALEDVAEVRERLDGLETELEGLRHDVTDRIEATEDQRRDVTGRLEDVEDKLRRVAWVVSDLREETAGRDAHERAVDRIKRAAAQEGFTTAECARCGEGVHVALLTDPECPHCNATVSDVRPEGGFLRSTARLVPASQLESGGELEDG